MSSDVATPFFYTKHSMLPRFLLVIILKTATEHIIWLFSLRVGPVSLVSHSKHHGNRWHCRHVSVWCVKFKISLSLSQLSMTVWYWLTLWSCSCTCGHGVSEYPDVKIYKWQLNPVWHRMLYSCTHMAYGNSGHQRANTVNVRRARLILGWVTAWLWVVCSHSAWPCPVRRLSHWAME